MENYHGQSQVRVLVAPSRSGTTAFMHGIAHHPQVATASRALTESLRQTGRCDYSIYKYDGPSPFLFYKATIGMSDRLGCTYDPFPDNSSISHFKPLFLFRDPLQTWESWKRVGKGNLDLFVTAYKHTRDLFLRCREISESVRCLTYECLGESASDFFPKILDGWEIPWDEKVISWDKELGSETITHAGLDKVRERFEASLASDLHRRIAGGPKMFHLVKNEIELPGEEVENIEDELRAIYTQITALSTAWF